MKNWMKKQLALILAVVMCLNLFMVPAAAEGTDAESTAVSVVEDESPETLALQVENGDLEQGDFSGEGEMILGGTSDVLEGDEGFLGCADEDAQDGGVQVAAGGDDAELGFEEDPAAGLDTEEELTDFQEDVNFETGGQLTLSDEETVDDENTEVLGLFGATVKTTKGEVVINKGVTTNVTIQYSGIPKGGYLTAGTIFGSDIVGVSWDGASGGNATLKLTGKKSGTCYVEVFVCNKLGIPYDVTQIKINVCNATLSCSSGNTVSVTQGGATTLYFTAGGYNGEGVLSYNTTNANAFGCTLRNGTMTIEGKAQGTGKINVFYTAKKTDDVLKTMTIHVTVKGVSKPKLTLSTSYVSLTAGETMDVKATFSGYGGGVYLRYGANTSAVSFGSAPNATWQNQSRMLRIKALKNGSGTLTVDLMAADTNTVLATAYITVVVAPKPTITPGSASLTLTAGKSGSVAYTLGNVTNQHSISCTNSNAKVCAVSLAPKNGKYMLTVSGKNAGTATVAVIIKDGRGAEKARATLTVTVKPAPPELKASASTMSMQVGQTGVAYFTYANCSGKVSMSASRSSNCCTVAWNGWNGTSAPLTIKGVEPGTCTITVKLLQNGQTVATKTLTVTVTEKASKNRLDIKSISYGFDNYLAKISLKNYQRIFGSNEYAKKLHGWYEGEKHGVCFGMATSSVLIYENTVYASEFGASRISSLTENYKSRTSSTYGIKLSDFIEMMYTTQFAKAITGDYVANINKAANLIISEIDKGNPVCVGVMSTDRGHEVVAIGYSLSGNTLTVDIYDNNYPMEIRTLTIKRPSSGSAFNSWSYYNGFSYTYSSSNGDSLDALEASSVKAVWNNRGNYSAVTNANLKNMNMVCTKEDTFSLYTIDMDTMTDSTVVEYQDGKLVSLAEGAFMVPVVGDAETEDMTRCIFVPQDYYYVEDGTPEDGMAISITSETLSTSLNMEVSPSEEDAIGFCAVDTGEEPLATASISVADGASYEISIGMTDENGESSSITKEGIGCGAPVSLGLEGDMLSLGAADDSQSAVLTEDPVIRTYEIDASAGEGGTISADGLTEYAEYENALYTITADEGYTISSVYVDGEDVGPVSSWYFENIEADHDIDVVFKKNVEGLTLSLDQAVYAYTGEAVEPVVTLTDGADRNLVENEDYIVTYDNNVKMGTATVTVMATADSGYYGVLEQEFRIEGTSVIESVKAEGSTIQVTMKEAAYAEPSMLVAAVYRADGQMVYVGTKALQTYGEPVVFTLDAALKATDCVKLFTLTADNRYKPLEIAYETPVT